MSLFSLGLTRAIVGQAAGLLFGMALTMFVRVLMGLEAWSPEPAWTVGAIFSIIASLWAVGAFDDWLSWTKGVATELHHGPPKDRPAWTRYFGVDYNHKVIGIQYTVWGIFLLLIGGTVAMIFRVELARAGLQFLDLQLYNSFIGMHGMIMIFAILLGIGGMANYLVPLMIGAEDMAFPRLNALGFWFNVPGSLLLLLSLFVGGWDAGWTGYPPLSARGPVGYQLFFLGVFAIGLSSVVGSLNLLVTILRMRPKGMSLFRMPIFCWAVFATSMIQLTATQLIGLSFLMVSMQRVLGMGFFDPGTDPFNLMTGGGDPILFQHMFWFYSHPAVYIFVLPGLGIISELLPVFARKPLFGYKWIALSSVAIAIVGFLVWGHHMFTSGYNDILRIPFMYSTLLVAVPTGVKFFSWLGTIWGGNLRFPTPMLFVLGAISVFLIGGLSGPVLATVPTDLPLHDSYFVVGHFHATMFGGFIFPFFAALYFWFPKVTGRMYNETLGKIHFWLMTPAFWVQTLGQMGVGVMGMRRRIADYDPLLGGASIEAWQMTITIAGFTIAFGVLLMLWNFFQSAEVGVVAGDNPWRSRSPEWQIPSPIPEHSFSNPLVVVGEPYDYGLPGSSYVSMVPGAVPTPIQAHAHD
jgi:cytochrome c oxidase subunit I